MNTCPFLQAVAAITEANIDSMREKYVSVAETACVLFFGTNCLQQVDSMYQVRGCRMLLWVFQVRGLQRMDALAIILFVFDFV
jgi:hypothetical protein